MAFVTGHVIWSFGVPIALVERLRPALSDRPWLRLPGLAVSAALYLAAAGLVLQDHLRTERDYASPAQIAGALAAGALLDRAVIGFFAVPLGDVAPVAKYGHNIVLLVGAVLLGVWAARRNRPAGAAWRRYGREPRWDVGRWGRTRPQRGS